MEFGRFNYESIIAYNFLRLKLYPTSIIQVKFPIYIT